MIISSKVTPNTLWQVLPTTAWITGMRWSQSEWRNPCEFILCTCRCFNPFLQIFKWVRKAWTSFNWSPIKLMFFSCSNIKVKNSDQQKMGCYTFLLRNHMRMSLWHLQLHWHKGEDEWESGKADNQSHGMWHCHNGRCPSCFSHNLQLILHNSEETEWRLIHLALLAKILSYNIQY